MRSVVEETAYETYLEKLADGTDDLDRSGNVGALITDAVEFDRKHPEDGTLELYLEQVSLVADTDAFEDENDHVTLMTLHAAKGLEFPHVFIIAVEDETIPHYRSQESDEQFEEERRLLFVGITRAMQRLQLSFCKRRSSRGHERPVIPSPFLNELPQDELQFIDPTVFSSQSFAETFDLEESDSGYPDAWDFEGDTDSEGDATADSVREAEAMCQLPEAEQPPASGGRDRRPAPGSQPSVAALTTAANLMSGGAVSLADYRAGTSVRHPTYGEGTILTVTGRGPKRTAQIQFESGTIQFRLAFADLELL